MEVRVRLLVPNKSTSSGPQALECWSLPLGELSRVRKLITDAGTIETTVKCMNSGYVMYECSPEHTKPGFAT